MPRRVRSSVARLLLLAALGPALFAGPADAAPSISLVPVVTGISTPTAIVNARDGSGRLFLVQQGGQIRVYAGGQILGTPFLNIGSVIASGGERGLLGLAFHPSYATNRAFYVYYTNTAGNVVIARYLVSAANPNVADPASGVVLLTIPHPTYGNHNGGQLAFGPDGYLYAGVGDGGGGGDPTNNGQNLGSLLGKVLRIDVDAPPPHVPAGNPFGSLVWALGFRNPWRFSFDRLTGDLLIADVGQGSREEIDFQPAGSPGGRNYCWPNQEGFAVYDANRPCNGGGVPTPPILDYTHALGCSVTGGYRYRGVVYPGLVGTYFYGDYCSGRIWGANNVGGTWSTVELLDTTLSISTFGEDEAGEVYLADYAGGVIYRIVSQRPVTGVGVYRSTTGQWFLRGADGGLTAMAWGAALLDVAVPADYDGDGQLDVAVYRPSTGEWFIRRSTDGGLTYLPWGAPTLGDVPVPADYDGDRRTDIAVYRRATGEWFIRRSRDGGLTQAAWGAPALGDLPVPADYDGDHRADIAVYRRATGEWFIRLSSDDTLRLVPWGSPFLGDIPAPEDYDGDGRADVAVYRTATGLWLIQRSTDLGLTALAWGAPVLGDVPVPAQYDGHGHADIAVYRPPSGQWFIRHSSDGQLSAVSWGSAALGDVPLPRPAALR
jgi:glucose/arabinose dehydrogenase